jgi:hypothetical protein
VSAGQGEDRSGTLTDGSSENESGTVGNSHTDGDGEVDTESTGRASGSQSGQDLVARAYHEAQRTAQSKALSKNRSDTSSHSATRGRGRNQSLARKVGRSANRGFSFSQAFQRTRSRLRAFSRSFTQTFKQTMVPILKWREVVRSVTHYTFDEQVALFAQRITQFRVGEGFLYIAGHFVEWIRVPLPREPYAESPRTLASILRGFRQQLLERPMYHTVENMVAYRRILLPEFLDRLLAQTRRDPEPVRLPRLVGDHTDNTHELLDI